MIAASLCAALLAQYDHLAWSDEFNGSALDLTKWTPQYGDGSQYGIPGWGNNEWQSYTDNPANLFVEDGRLHIVARQQNNQYTSARIRTLGNAEFTYGRMEARIKLPAAGQGLWPAFWMLPTNSPYGGWAAGGEIDIVEWINGMDVVHGTLHHGSAWPNNQQTGGSFNPAGGAITGFHNYAIEWDPDQIRWYFDGVLYSQKNLNQWFSDSAPGDAEAPFDWNFHFILNLAVGGNWPGYPNGSTPFPATLEVDWVRVWKREAPGTFANNAIPGTIEAEHFDRGGQSVGFWDADHTNNGGSLRTDQGVDIGSVDGGGHYVGWIEPMEWLQFTTDVECGGIHTVRARVASQSTGGTFHLESNGVNLTGPIAVPSTGGWQNWVEVEAQLTLATGTQIPIRFVNDSGSDDGYNIDSLVFERIDDNPSCGEVLGPCCLSDSCQLLSTSACASAGGLFAPGLDGCSAPSACEGAGACCFPDATCISATLENCSFGGGVFQGSSMGCTSAACPLLTGACCIGSSCAILEASLCEQTGGVFGGEATSCGDVSCAPPCPGDFNNDSTIGFDDLLFVLSDWDGTQADLDGSGTTDFADVLILLAGFGPC